MTGVSHSDRTSGAFFNGLAKNWSQAHYGPQGGMVARIARFTDALESVVPVPARVLDYGCGTGNIAVALAARGYQVEGRDTSPNMIEQARVIHADSAVRFSVIGPADATSGDQVFDAIVCSSVLEYLQDLPDRLQSLVGALKSGGWLLATVPNIDHPVRRGEALHRLLWGNTLLRSVIRRTPKAESYELQWLSRNRFPIPAWAALFQTAGLQPVWQDCEDHPLTLLIGQRRR